MKIKIAFLILLVILFATIIVQSFNLSKEKDNGKDLSIKLYNCQESLLTVRAAHNWVPILEQILPKLTKRELDAVAEQITQTKQKTLKRKK